MFNLKGSQEPIRQTEIVLVHLEYNKFLIEKNRYGNRGLVVNREIVDNLFNDYDRVLLASKEGIVIKSNFKIEPPKYLKENYNLKSYGLDKVYKGV